MGNKYKYLYGTGCCDLFDFNDKQKNTSSYVAYMLSRTQMMFEYTNLPETIPSRNLELYLQSNGNVCIAEYKDNLYAFVGGLGGEPNVYYMPTIYTVANPTLKMSESYKIDENCVVIPSDSMYIGLLPLFSKYATQMAENDITMLVTDINMRIVSLISADDDRTFESAKQYIKDIKDGKMGIISSNSFLDGLKTQPYSSSGNSNILTNLIEYQQYLKASWYNDIGLQSNFNMKRESLNSNETSLNESILLPLVDDMLNCRKLGLDKVNKMFGTDISVEKSSSWNDMEKMISGQPEIDDMK